MKRRPQPYWIRFSNASLRPVLTMSLMICFALSSLASIFIVTTSNHLGFTSFREDITLVDSSIGARENESASELSAICLVPLLIEICDNGIDDDGDGLIDCQDSDCAEYDWDGDTVCDLEDIDDDNDGVLDEDECLVTITFEDLTDTRFYSYAQTTSGCRAHHFGELDQGTSNDPSLLFDGDLNTEFRMHKNDFVEFGLGQVVPAGAEIIMEEGSGWEDEKLDIYVSYGSTDPSGDSNTASWSCGGVGYATATSGGAHLIQQNVKTNRDFAFTVPFDITHVQFRGRENHAGWGEMRFTSSTQVVFNTTTEFCDTDGDGIANHLDLDSDGDGCSDAYEAGATNNITTGYQFESADINNDGLVDELDQDIDGQPNYLSSYSVKALDEGFSDCLDTDNDGVPDVLDMDDDNDGIPDDVEIDCSFKKIRVNEDLGLLPGVDNQSGSADISARLGLPPYTVTVDYTNVHVSGVSYVESSLVNTHYTINSNTPLLLRLGHGSILAGGAADGFIVDDIDSYDFTSTLVGGLLEASENSNLSVLNTSGGYINNIQKFFWNRKSPSAVAFQNTFEAFTTTVGSNAGYTFSLCIPADTDGDGVYDYLDLDSDNDGIFDLVEASHGEADVDNNGIIDGPPAAFGSNGLFDGVESTAESGVLNYVVSDSDGDGSIDAIDLDSDNDDCPDVLEAGFSDDDLDGELGNTPVATNSEGIVISGADGYTSPMDSDSNGVDDYIQTGTAPVLVSMDSPGPVCSEGSLNFIVNATGADPYYQWQISVDGGINYVNINAPGIQPTHSDFNTAELSLINIPLTSNEHYYRAIVFDGTYRCDSLVSPGLLLTVDNPMPPIGDAEQTFCAGDIPTVSELVASGSDVRWYENPTGGPALNSTEALEHNKRYYASQTIASCESDTRLDVVVYLTDPDAPAGAELQYFCTNANPVLSDINTSESSVLWYDALTGGNVLAPNAPLVNGQTYYASTLSGACAGLTRLSVRADLTDVTPPIAVCQAVIMNLGGGTVSLTPADVDGGSTDDCLIDNMMVTPNSLSAVGTHTVMLTVTDLAGNTDECSVSISVVDTTPPVAICQDILVYLNLNGDVTLNAQDLDGGSTDNGNIVDWSATQTAFNCTDLGPNNVTITVTDDASPAALSDQCVAIVTVLDTIAPAIVCQDITIQLDADGLASIVPSQLDGGTTDACGFTLTAAKRDFDCEDTGANNVLLTATDASGNSSTCVATITVEDLILPDMDCTAPIVVANDPGVCGAAVTYTLPAVIDNCSSSIVAVLSTGPGHTSGSVFPIGVTFVGYSATNPYNGQATTCMFPITVNDTEGPSISCPADIVVDSDPAVCGAVVNYTAPVGVDNCGGATTVQSDATGLTSGDTFPIGVTTLEYTVTDVSGNTTVCSFTVTVNDNEDATIISCPSDILTNNDPGVCGAQVNYATPTATDNCAVSTIVQTDGSGYTSGDVFPIGITNIEYTITDDSGNTSVCAFTVTVIDNEDPVAVCQTVTLNLGGGTVVLSPAQVFDAGASSDNCPTVTPISVAPDIFSAIGTYTVTLTVEDESGNTDQCSLDITVIDTTPPNAVCIATGIDVFLDATGNVIVDGQDLDNGSTDNGVIVSYVADPANFDCSDTGINPITLIVTDDGGNSSSCLTTVNVLDTISPVAVCQDLTIQLDAIGNAGISVANVDAGSSDNCAGISLALDKLDFDCSDVGVNTVILTVTDASGNTSTCLSSVTVQDIIVPSITCPADMIQSTDAGLPTATVTVPVPVTDDNCSILSVLNDFNSSGNASGVYPNGTTTVIWTVTDVNGNSSQCSMTVTIEDTTPPELDCPTDVDVDATIGICEEFVTIPVPTPTDNDGIATIVNDWTGTDDASAIYPVGPTTVTWTVTDVNGNSVTCEQLVFVNDIEEPTIISCPADSVISATIGECGIDGALVVLEAPVATDPCDTVIITSDAPLVYPVGETTVTWSIADTTGNVSYCTQIVTIADVENPTLTSCPSDVIVNNDLGICGAAIENVMLGAPAGTDPCGDPVITNNAPAIFPVGETTVTWYLEDINGNIDSTCTQLLTVIDNENPIITDCPAPLSIDATIDECGIGAAMVDLGNLVATDNCGLVVTSNDAPLYFPVGQTTVTWTVLDGVSNSSICTQLVTINDVQTPTDLVCPSDTLITTTIGECGIEGFLVDLDAPTAEDACGLVLISSDAPAYYPVGITTVTWSIADTSGNVLTCTQLVEIEDLELPTMTACPSDIVVSNDPGICGAIVSYDLPEATDPCGITSISLIEGLLSGEQFPIGTTTVTYAIEDANGNINTCTFDVTVNDTEAPVFADPVVIIYEAIEGACESVVTFNIPVGTDNCPGAITVQTDTTGYTSGDIMPVGLTQLCYLVTDASGNSTETCIDIVVQDVEAPILVVCPDDVVLTADEGICGALYLPFTPSATDNCGDVVYTHDGPQTFPVGLTMVTWTISDDAGNSIFCYQDITVTDDEAPEIICPDDEVVIAAWGGCEAMVTAGLAIAQDNCAVDSVWNDFNNTSNATDIYPLGETMVTWTVLDVNGNSTQCSMLVTVETPGAPIIECPEGISVSAAPGLCEQTIIVPPIVLDNPCSVVTIVNDYTDTDDASGTYPSGVTIVTWTVTDISGYSSECTMTVTVIDDQAPSIVCPEDISVSNDPGICGAYVDYIIPEISDNCEIDNMIMVNGVSPGGLFNVGTTEVIYQVTDVWGNSTVCGFEVTVSDDEAPTISCPESFVQVDSIVDYAYPDYYDNCYAELILIDGPDTGEEFDHGYTYVSFAAVDLNGNMDTCGFQVLVNTPPVAVNDTVVIFESDDVLEIEILENDYDLDGDSIFMVDLLYGHQFAYYEDDVLFFNIPDNECGLDSVSYVIMDEYGATDTVMVYVEVECYPNVFIPEGFSPNGDGVNDVLHILGIHEYPDNKLTVFNRWGHKVYERHNYQNDWEGRSEAELTIGVTNLPRATYYYILDLGESNIKPMKGFFYINPQ